MQKQIMDAQKEFLKLQDKSWFKSDLLILQEFQ